LEKEFGKITKMYIFGKNSTFTCSKFAHMNLPKLSKSSRGAYKILGAKARTFVQLYIFKVMEVQTMI